MKFVLIQVDLFLLHTYIQNVVQPRYCEIMLAKIGHWNSSGRAKMMVVVYDISSKMFCTMASVVEKAPREPSATSSWTIFITDRSTPHNPMRLRTTPQMRPVSAQSPANRKHETPAVNETVCHEMLNAPQPTTPRLFVILGAIQVALSSATVDTDLARPTLSEP